MLSLYMCSMTNSQGLTVQKCRKSESNYSLSIFTSNLIKYKENLYVYIHFCFLGEPLVSLKKKKRKP